LYVIVAIIVLALVGWLIMRGNTSDLPLPDAQRGGAAAVSSQDGSVSVGPATTMPANWPSDVPTYAGASLQYSGTSNPSTGEAGSAIVFTTKDTADAILTFYKTQLVASGWKIEGEANVSGMTTLGATKDTRNLGMYIAPSTEGVDTTVTIGISGV